MERALIDPVRETYPRDARLLNWLTAEEREALIREANAFITDFGNSLMLRSKTSQRCEENVKRWLRRPSQVSLRTSRIRYVGFCQVQRTPIPSCGDSFHNGKLGLMPRFPRPYLRHARNDRPIPGGLGRARGFANLRSRRGASCAGLHRARDLGSRAGASRHASAVVDLTDGARPNRQRSVSSTCYRYATATCERGPLWSARPSFTRGYRITRACTTLAT